MKPAFFSYYAEVDLREQYRWYEEQQLGLGRRFIQAVDETVKRIEQNPLLGQRFGLAAKRRLLLSPPFSRFSVVYFDHNTAIELIAIWAGERDPNEFTKR
jgi:plasmid stabilization system protein ParE